MVQQYDPETYWESRLTRRFNLQGVGHVSFGETYNKWLYQRKKSCIDRFLKGTSLEGRYVLDVGCGTGFFVEFFLNKGAIVTGLDITAVSANRLRAKFPSANFIKEDIANHNYSRPRQFDLVNVWDVLYHIVDDDAFERAVRNIRGSLAPGGLILLNDFLGNTDDAMIASHVKGRSLKTYRNLLEREGFVLSKMAPLYNMLATAHVRKLDNHLGWLYFLTDLAAKKIRPNRLCLSAWRYLPKRAGA